MDIQLTSLECFQFKNLIEHNFKFEHRIVCITGKNGVGKTSILDAIHFLCMTKSYFSYQDSACVTMGKIGLRLVGTISSDKKMDQIVCIIRENGKKEIVLNDESYTQFSKHIGKFPCVMIAPDDTQLIHEGSEARRKFMDTMLSQLNPTYMNYLIRYNKVLTQRNALLKQFDTHVDDNEQLFQIYNEQLHDLGSYIYTCRKDLMLELNVETTAIYSKLSNAEENVNLSYSSRLENESLISLLQNNFHKDKMSQRTNYGIHKDDIIFNLNGMQFKQGASQGQKKSLLFSLKLAQYKLIEKALGKCPILLLDDIFEKLDAHRTAQLINFISNIEAQVFITDTHSERIIQAFDSNIKSFQMIEMK